VNLTDHVACDSYHLPEHVQPHVDFVTPTVHFDAKITKRSGSGSTEGIGRSIGQPGSGTAPKTAGQIQTLLNELEACDQQITPICLRALYGLVYEPLAASQNSYGIGKQYYVQNWRTKLTGRQWSTPHRPTCRVTLICSIATSLMVLLELPLTWCQ